MSTLSSRLAGPLARGLAALALLAAAALPLPASAAFVAYGGSGNAVLFDPGTGEGGWVGAIDEVPDPAIAAPLSLVSVVFFQFDAASGLLSGQFEFTDSTDLDSVLTGTVSGSSADADPFSSGGQFALDYRITGGLGRFAGARGFGLAFLDIRVFDPLASSDNYAESGLLVFGVPTPGTLGLAAAALLLLGGTGRLARAARTPA